MVTSNMLFLCRAIYFTWHVIYIYIFTYYVTKYVLWIAKTNYKLMSLNSVQVMPVRQQLRTDIAAPCQNITIRNTNIQL
jgi:hypothetical protein